MMAAIDLSGELSGQAILQMHQVLLDSQPRHTPGAWRDEPVWIGSRSDTPVGAEFVAPHHSRRSEEHTSELQSRGHLVCRRLLEEKNRCVRAGASPAARYYATQT